MFGWLGASFVRGPCCPLYKILLERISGLFPLTTHRAGKFMRYYFGQIVFAQMPWLGNV